MTVERERPSRLTELGSKVPMWLYRAHLGFLFGGRIFAGVHHGRMSGKRSVSGLEVLVRRRPAQEGTIVAFRPIETR